MNELGPTRFWVLKTHDLHFWACTELGHPRWGRIVQTSASNLDGGNPLEGCLQRQSAGCALELGCCRNALSAKPPVDSDVATNPAHGTQEHSRGSYQSFEAARHDKCRHREVTGRSK